MQSKPTGGERKEVYDYIKQRPKGLKLSVLIRAFNHPR